MMSDDVKNGDITTPEYNENGMENKKLVIIPKQDPQYITKKQQFTCDLCAASFSMKHDIKSHLNVHTGVGIYKCYVCPATFTKKSYLKLQFRNHSR